MKVKGKIKKFINSSRVDGLRKAPILSGQGDDESEHDVGTSTIVKPRVKRPPRYKVLLHNDDYTTMEFVVYVLQKHFQKTIEEAQDIMLRVHHEGVGICGIYTFEIAETKCEKVKREAKANGHPLKCTLEPEEDGSEDD